MMDMSPSSINIGLIVGPAAGALVLCIAIGVLVCVVVRRKTHGTDAQSVAAAGSGGDTSVAAAAMKPLTPYYASTDQVAPLLSASPSPTRTNTLAAMPTFGTLQSLQPGSTQELSVGTCVYCMSTLHSLFCVDAVVHRWHCSEHFSATTND
jgi:hypothetical protein